MHLRFVAAVAAVLFSSAIARADSFSYDFSNTLFNDAFTYVSPVLFTADAQFQADTCSIGGVSRTCTISLVLSNEALAIVSLTGTASFNSLGPDFFTLGTHSIRENTLTISQISAVAPEPSSMVLLGTGALALLTRSRRRFLR
ncbi:PEP-CTERM sorting domain-containing protein [Granulicella sp. dw_53]|uniref:PEP-CTERM sorting domain-containing protein n=1 Tax=Granulicella sp. dw_53 TaxID=2719792 RepID=UPI001BD32581|nr:PEP-CTERM sorting domain-containing protein [Granulicella sp. dw_53]